MSGTSSGRQLVAAQSPGDDDELSGQRSNPSSRPKRTLIESACIACRRRKSKCDGLRPSCSRCQTLRTECLYEAEEGESRWSALRRRSQALEYERDDLREILSWLLLRPEHEALEAFHRIRTISYDELLATARQSRENNSGTGPQMVSSPSPTEQRLPPIRTLVDVSGPSHPHGQMSSRPGIPPSAPSEGSVESSYSSNYSAQEPPPQPPRPPDMFHPA